MGNIGTLREDAHIIIWTDNIMVWGWYRGDVTARRGPHMVCVPS